VLSSSSICIHLRLINPTQLQKKLSANERRWTQMIGRDGREKERRRWVGNAEAARYSTSSLRQA
jgi:hypothetical protein